ncbi:hypothetical protein LINPERPRIM_LOCUS4170 [Linum perenne]
MEEATCLHQIPNPLPDYPLPSLRVIISISFFRHRLPRVAASPPREAPIRVTVTKLPPPGRHYLVTEANRSSRDLSLLASGFRSGSSRSASIAAAAEGKEQYPFIEIRDEKMKRTATAATQMSKLVIEDLGLYFSFGGGETSVVGFDTDYLSYQTLNAVAKEDLGYTIVHRMWWLPPKKTMASGLREIFRDMDILYGLMIDVKKVDDGQVVMFFEAEREVSGGWDNEVGNLGDDEGFNSDDDAGAQMSVQPPLFVVSDDSSESDHGVDPQYKKRRIRTVYYNSGGEEVEQCNGSVFSVAGNSGNPNQVSEQAVEHSMSDLNITPNSASTEYRQSSGCDHIRPDLSDEGSYDAADYEPIQQVTRDFSNVRLRQGMRFINAASFKDFVGADILWLKSCQSKMEAVCRDRCGWRVYGSWNSRKESFILKCLGEKHTCPRALENKQASAKWIARTYIEKFRITPK